MRADHSRSICLEYSLNLYILNMGDKKNINRGDSSRTEEPEWHSYLSVAFEEIVVPMNLEIRQIMVQYKILNEGELYCTNLEYNLEDDKQSKLIGDPGQKGEDSVKAINAKLKEMQEKYSKLKDSLISAKRCNPIGFAKAVYFASYYNPDNYAFRSYRDPYVLDNRTYFVQFHTKWNTNRISTGFSLDKWEQMQELDYYQKTLKKGKNGSEAKIDKILIHKQFFSAPWLICFNHYLV